MRWYTKWGPTQSLMNQSSCDRFFHKCQVVSRKLVSWWCFWWVRSMDSNVKDEKAAEVVVTKKAFYLACSWVQKMSGGADFYVEEETKGLPDDDGANSRPTRLGLGATYLSHAQANCLSTQVDKKLRAKLVPTEAGTSYQASRRDSKARDNYEEEEVQAHGEDEDEDVEDDSRASVFKKRPSAFIRPTLIVSETAGSKRRERDHRSFLLICSMPVNISRGDCTSLP